MRRGRWPAFGAAAIALLAPPAAAQKIEVGKTVTISADAPSDPHGESFLAVNPKNPKNMLAAVCRISKGKMGTSGYVSRDGGLSWTRVVLPEGAAKVSTGWDAIAYFDGKGNAFYGANDGAGLWITRSSDEGRTWSDATLLLGAEGFDRQYMGFDRTGRWAGRIYAGASVESLGLDGKSRSALAISFSDDGGKTFGQPYLFTSTPDERIFTFVNMVVTPDGKVILPFLTMPERVMPDWTLWDSHEEIKSLPDYSMSLRVAASDDGGKELLDLPRVATTACRERPIPRREGAGQRKHRDRSVRRAFPRPDLHRGARQHRGSVSTSTSCTPPTAARPGRSPSRSTTTRLRATTPTRRSP